MLFASASGAAYATRGAIPSPTPSSQGTISLPMSAGNREDAPPSLPRTLVLLPPRPSSPRSSRLSAASHATRFHFCARGDPRVSTRARSAGMLDPPSAHERALLPFPVRCRFTSFGPRARPPHSLPCLRGDTQADIYTSSATRTPSSIALPRRQVCGSDSIIVVAVLAPCSFLYHGVLRCGTAECSRPPLSRLLVTCLSFILISPHPHPHPHNLSSPEHQRWSFPSSGPPLLSASFAQLHIIIAATVGTRFR